MRTDAGTEADALGRLFVETTGETWIREPQQADANASHLAETDLDEYKRRHDALSRHEALRDALSNPGDDGT